MPYFGKVGKNRLKGYYFCLKTNKVFLERNALIGFDSIIKSYLRVTFGFVG